MRFQYLVLPFIVSKQKGYCRKLKQKSEKINDIFYQRGHGGINGGEGGGEWERGGGKGVGGGGGVVEWCVIGGELERGH